MLSPGPLGPLGGLGPFLTYRMTFLRSIIDLFLHVDTHLASIIDAFGLWTYVILVVVIFCETGLVFIPFLPGDSLLFAAGAFAARGAFNPVVLALFLSAAAILGDSCNYWLGGKLGRKAFREGSRLLNIEHLRSTEKFYEKYGNKAILLARFLPIFRTVAPFVAGIGKMHYPTFIFYNVIGGVLWVTLFVFVGYFFGTIPAVEHNFTLVILAIIALSLFPVFYHAFQHWRAKK